MPAERTGEASLPWGITLVGRSAKQLQAAGVTDVRKEQSMRNRTAASGSLK